MNATADRSQVINWAIGITMATQDVDTSAAVAAMQATADQAGIPFELVAAVIVAVVDPGSHRT